MPCPLNLPIPRMDPLVPALSLAHYFPSFSSHPKCHFPREGFPDPCARPTVLSLMGPAAVAASTGDLGLAWHEGGGELLSTQVRSE